MNGWDNVRSRLEKLKNNKSKILGNWSENKKKIDFYMDKYKVVKRLYIIGIIANFAIFYFNYTRFLHLSIINKRVIQNK